MTGSDGGFTPADWSGPYRPVGVKTRRLPFGIVGLDFARALAGDSPQK
jgi:hypothetical protein